MKQNSMQKSRIKWTVVLSSTLFVFSFLVFSSFKANKFADDVLKQLGMNKTDADEKINNSILGGSLDAYGVKNLKAIATGNRTAIALDLLNYTRKQVNSEAFISKYKLIKENNKPKLSVAQTPEEMKAENLAMAKKFVEQSEEMVKKADANTKAIFEKSLADAKKNLQQAEDPNNKQFAFYAKNYPALVANFKQSNEAQLAQWEKQYPSNHLLYVKTRLQEFMEATKDIDFNAELTTRNGKKIFVNPAYESKGHRWKMAYRAGKEVVEPAREFVQKWIDEIK